MRYVSTTVYISSGRRCSFVYRKAGAKCNGPPGLRPHYASTYYGAFVLDPEGRNIEAVCLWPGILAEPKSWNAIVATIVLAVGVGVGYFTGLSSYLL